MLRQNANPLNSELIHASDDASIANGASFTSAPQMGPVDIQREINRMEEMILDCPRIPLSRRTLVDEDQLLYQLDLVRLALPTAFQEALDIIRHRDQIVVEAEQYASDVIEAAQRQAAQILDETGLVHQAEAEATQIRQRVQEECEAVREQAIAEIEHMRRQSQKDVEAFQKQVVAESTEIQRGADEYADRVLRDMERQMSEMIRVIRNGRQHLQIESPAQKALPGDRPLDNEHHRSSPPRSIDRHS